MLGTSRLVTAGKVLLGSLSLLGCIVSTNHSEPVPEVAEPLLIKILKDPDPSQRKTAAQSLGKIGREEALPALIEALQDPDPGVRREAAWAVGMIGKDNTSARQALIQLLFDANPGVRESASAALARTGEAASGLQLLEARLFAQDTSSDTRRLAAAALGGMAVIGSSAIVGPLLNDQDAVVRRWAVAAIADIGDRDASTSLARALTSDPSPGVRIEAAFHLGKLGDPAAQEALTLALTDPDEHVRLLAKSGLP